VPPQKLRIIDNNREVSSVIGPFDEGAQLSLNCIVSGGITPFYNWLNSFSLKINPRVLRKGIYILT